MTCLPSGLFEVVTCEANECVPTEVPNSDMSAPNAITGVTEDQIRVTCDAGYSGGGEAVCTADGTFVPNCDLFLAPRHVSRTRT